MKPKAGLTELVTGELPPEETIVQARENLWLLAGGRSLAGIKRLIDLSHAQNIKSAKRMRILSTQPPNEPATAPHEKAIRVTIAVGMTATR